jgi:hypothetical protein
MSLTLLLPDFQRLAIQRFGFSIPSHAETESRQVHETGCDQRVISSKTLDSAFNRSSNNCSASRYCPFRRQPWLVIDATAAQVVLLAKLPKVRRASLYFAP